MVTAPIYACRQINTPALSYLTGGTAGVCDRFCHLDRSVLMNILIMPERARACWVSSRPPFPEINMGKRGRGGKTLQQGRRFSNLNAVLTQYNQKFAMSGYV